MKFDSTMYPVNSGKLARIGWQLCPEKKEGVLRAEFRNGIQYDFRPVPGEVFSSVFRAESKGKWFISKIEANKSYAYEKVPDEDLAL